MPRPLVIAYHLIFTAYGWWLPNDPRGSRSHTIRCDVFKDLGELHFERKRIQPASKEIKAFYREAAKRLKHALLVFDDRCIQTIAESINEVIQQHKYRCWACAIMPDHVHLLIRKHKHTAEQMIENFQTHSRLRLRASGASDEDHPIWGGPGWTVYLDHPDEVRRLIRYIENNPIKIGWPQQHWPFVDEYNNWPLHPGHSPDSPYVKRLKAVGRYP